MTNAITTTHLKDLPDKVLETVIEHAMGDNATRRAILAANILGRRQQLALDQAELATKSRLYDEFTATFQEEAVRLHDQVTELSAEIARLKAAVDGLYLPCPLSYFSGDVNHPACVECKHCHCKSLRKGKYSIDDYHHSYCPWLAEHNRREEAKK